MNFVEFLDFECEACGAVYPAIEQLRQQYGDRVNFVIGYFPAPGHINGERSSRAVEAAAQRRQLERMYKLTNETQTEWGEQQVPRDDRFLGYAEQLGMDMARCEAAYNDPATLERVLADREAGLALGCGVRRRSSSTATSSNRGPTTTSPQRSTMPWPGADRRPPPGLYRVGSPAELTRPGLLGEQVPEPRAVGRVAVSAG